MDSALFFAPIGSTWGQAHERRNELRMVREMCAHCPVRVECLEAGRDEAGWWGGLSERERRRLAQVRHDVDEQRENGENSDDCPHDVSHVAQIPGQRDGHA